MIEYKFFKELYLELYYILQHKLISYWNSILTDTEELH